MPIVVNTIILAAGFFVMTTSAFKMNVDLGLMTILSIAGALILDFLLLPALLLFGRNKEQPDTVGSAELAQATA
jgi:predicted RND superfamily exporter protein